ncbi:MptD family putative ECF transporter S component [Corynebacterium lizhenjunii]|uniref:MptD family putative ECF transporter S component n=1 Tax=Corynebacterium lizhenjunii TaxID=2709394 RepID=A0A7T0KFA2_9CORY|nr:MptD family putative ECF transporter S component [Corynebacterium lizhenjunii]QPK78999.1 MptD family putative ECF transporter S component [Corynebacterium lizhenjunii]
MSQKNSATPAPTPVTTNPASAASAPTPAPTGLNSAHRLNTRDLINAGVFSALYFVVTYATGMVGFAGPQFMFLGWFIGIIANGIVLALYVARTPKLGALTILGGLNGLVFMLTGHYFWTLLGGIGLGFLADLLITKTGVSVPKIFPVAYGVLCMWIAFPFIPLVLDSDAYFADIAEQMGPQYADVMSHLFQPWTIAAVVLGAVISGLIGGFFGVRVSRKHFESAGLL